MLSDIFVCFVPAEKPQEEDEALHAPAAAEVHAESSEEGVRIASSIADVHADEPEQLAESSGSATGAELDAMPDEGPEIDEATWKSFLEEHFGAAAVPAVHLEGLEIAGDCSASVQKYG